MSGPEQYAELIALHGAARVGASMLRLGYPYPPADDDAVAWSVFLGQISADLNGGA